MIDSSLQDDPWDEIDLGSDYDFAPDAGVSARSDGWDSDSWIEDEPWFDDDSWGEGNLSESLTIKYLGPQAIRAA